MPDFTIKAVVMFMAAITIILFLTFIVLTLQRPNDSEGNLPKEVLYDRVKAQNIRYGVLAFAIFLTFFILFFGVYLQVLFSFQYTPLMFIGLVGGAAGMAGPIFWRYDQFGWIPLILSIIALVGLMRIKGLIQPIYLRKRFREKFRKKAVAQDDDYDPIGYQGHIEPKYDSQGKITNEKQFLQSFEFGKEGVANVKIKL